MLGRTFLEDRDLGTEIDEELEEDEHAKDSAEVVEVKAVKHEKDVADSEGTPHNGEVDLPTQRVNGDTQHDPDEERSTSKEVKMDPQSRHTLDDERQQDVDRDEDMEEDEDNPLPLSSQTEPPAEWQ